MRLPRPAPGRTRLPAATIAITLATALPLAAAVAAGTGPADTAADTRSFLELALPAFATLAWPWKTAGLAALAGLVYWLRRAWRRRTPLSRLRPGALPPPPEETPGWAALAGRDPAFDENLLLEQCRVMYQRLQAGQSAAGGAGGAAGDVPAALDALAGVPVPPPRRLAGLVPLAYAADGAWDLARLAVHGAPAAGQAPADAVECWTLVRRRGAGPAEAWHLSWRGGAEAALLSRPALDRARGPGDRLAWLGDGDEDFCAAGVEGLAADLWLRARLAGATGDAAGLRRDATDRGYAWVAGLAREGRVASVGLRLEDVLLAAASPSACCVAVRASWRAYVPVGDGWRALDPARLARLELVRLVRDEDGGWLWDGTLTPAEHGDAVAARGEEMAYCLDVGLMEGLASDRDHAYRNVLVALAADWPLDEDTQALAVALARGLGYAAGRLAGTLRLAGAGGLAARLPRAPRRARRVLRLMEDLARRAGDRGADIRRLAAALEAEARDGSSG